MAEDWAIVRHKAITSADAFDVVTKIEECIAHAGVAGHWEKDTSISQASGELLLKPLSQTFVPPPALGDPNDQRVAVQAFAGGVVKFGYFPSGWDPGAATFNDVVNSSAVSWSGMRSITGTTSGFGALPDRVWVAQMRDELTTAAPYPGSSITVLLTASSVNEIKYAAHIGRVIACSDPSDFGLGVWGDACLTGGVYDIATANSWLKGAFSTGPTDNAVVFGGGSTWYYANVAYDPTAIFLDDVNGIKRLFPYSVYGLGRARGGTLDATTSCGIIGQTKYIREMDASFNYFIRVQSSTVGSNQQWRPAVYDTNSRPMVFLWGPEVEVP